MREEKDRWLTVGEMKVYMPEFFGIKEFFPPDMEVFYRDARAWLWANPLVLVTMDRLREKYGPAIMNTWGLSNETQKMYGTHYWRGWRTKDCTVGSALSQHKMGNAADMAFVDVHAETIRADILARPFDRTYEHITCIEMEVSWLHFDVRPRDKANKGVLQVRP